MNNLLFVCLKFFLFRILILMPYFRSYKRCFILSAYSSLSLTQFSFFSFKIFIYLVLIIVDFILMYREPKWYLKEFLHVTNVKNNLILKTFLTNILNENHVILVTNLKIQFMKKELSIVYFEVLCHSLYHIS